MRMYEGKRIGILGLSVEGIDSVEFFLRHGATVYCCDRRDESYLTQAKLPFDPKRVHFVMGSGYLDELLSYELIVRTPGMSLQLPQLLAAKKKGIEITSQIKLIFKHSKAPIIGVTGTKGKGTTSRLIVAMLTQADKKVHLGGNVGIPLLSKIDTISENEWVVLELSSFQLEDLTQSPHIAVVLPITRDHLKNFDPLATNYHESVEDYRNAKSSIVKFQSAQDVLIVNADNETSHNFKSLSKAKAYTYSGSDTTCDAYVKNNQVFIKSPTDTWVCSLQDIQLAGVHNLENIAAAALVAHEIGIKPETITAAVKKFAPLPHHLEFVREFDGVRYFNDSCATIPDPTIAALRSFVDPVVLIAGGSDKGAIFDELGKEIVQKGVRAVLCIGQVGHSIASAIEKAALTLKKTAPPVYTPTGGMEAIVKLAQSLAQPGDIVLLSPAAASFDMFTNYRERGDLFKEYVQSLQHSQKKR